MSGVGDEVDDQGLTKAAEKMRAAGAHEEAIRSFEDAYTRLRSGGESLLATADLEPVGDVPAFEDLPEADAAQALAQTALIKLNGGLATSMGLQEPKSLIEVHDGHTFLDVIVGQAQALRARYGVKLPLILMDSDATREATLAGAGRDRRRRQRRAGSRLPAEHDPQARRRHARAGAVAGRAGARVVPARARRRVRSAATLGDAAGAARARDPLRDDLQRRQPRRAARPADRRAHGGGARSRS